MVRFASGNYLGSLFMLASTLLLPIIITNESGAQATAYFFVPWAIATAVQLVVVNMDTSLTVEVAFDESKLRHYCRRVIVQTMRLVTPITLFLLAGAPYLLRLFGPSYAAEGATLLRLLAIAAIPTVIVALGLSVARIQKRGRVVLWVQAVQCAVTLSLTYVLLPHLGIDGVGIAWLISQGVLGALLIIGILRPVLLVGKE
jgi:O-antigen/teichoic acid export membrane protein